MNAFRSSRPKVFCKKVVLTNFVRFIRKHLAGVSFLIKLQAWAPQLKKRLGHRCFPVNFTKLLTTPLLCRTPLVAASSLRIATSCSCIKCLRSTCEILFSCSAASIRFLGMPFSSFTVFHKLQLWEPATLLRKAPT